MIKMLANLKYVIKMRGNLVRNGILNRSLRATLHWGNALAPHSPFNFSRRAAETLEIRADTAAKTPAAGGSKKHACFFIENAGCLALC